MELPDSLIDIHTMGLQVIYNCPHINCTLVPHIIQPSRLFFTADMSVNPRVVGLLGNSERFRNGFNQPRASELNENPSLHIRDLWHN